MKFEEIQEIINDNSQISNLISVTKPENKNRIDYGLSKLNFIKMEANQTFFMHK
jgi:hypothetical protein